MELEPGPVTNTLADFLKGRILFSFFNKVIASAAVSYAFLPNSSLPNFG
jgi:hypothetical protein